MTARRTKSRGFLKQHARQDYDQLLYVVLDQAVGKVGKPAKSQTSSATPRK